VEQHWVREESEEYQKKHFSLFSSSRRGEDFRLTIKMFELGILGAAINSAYCKKK
jgi:hypothetical protein